MNESEDTNILNMWELLHNDVDVMREVIDSYDEHEEEEGDMTKDELIAMLKHDKQEFMNELRELFFRLEVIEDNMQHGNEYVTLSEFEYMLQHHIGIKGLIREFL